MDDASLENRPELEKPFYDIHYSLDGKVYYQVDHELIKFFDLQSERIEDNRLREHPTIGNFVKLMREMSNLIIEFTENDGRLEDFNISSEEVVSSNFSIDSMLGVITYGHEYVKNCENFLKLVMDKSLFNNIRLTEDGENLIKLVKVILPIIKPQVLEMLSRSKSIFSGAIGILEEELEHKES